MEVVKTGNRVAVLVIAVVVGYGLGSHLPQPMLQWHEDAHLRAAARHGVAARQIDDHTVALLSSGTLAAMRDIYWAGYKSTLSLGMIVGTVLACIRWVWPAAGVGVGVMAGAYATALHSIDLDYLRLYLDEPDVYRELVTMTLWWALLPAGIVAYQLLRSYLTEREEANRGRTDNGRT